MLTGEKSEGYCSFCGLEREKWTALGGQGYKRGSEIYCCERCAEGKRCDCNPDKIARIVEDIGSGYFEKPHRNYGSKRDPQRARKHSRRGVT